MVQKEAVVQKKQSSTTIVQGPIISESDKIQLRKLVSERLDELQKELVNQQSVPCWKNGRRHISLLLSSSENGGESSTCTTSSSSFRDYYLVQQQQHDDDDDDNDKDKGTTEKQKNGVNKKLLSLNYFGFLHLRNFCSEQECYDMKHLMKDWVVNEWNINELETFGTDNAENVARADYFLESATNIHYFTEPSTVTKDDTNNNKITLKEEYLHNKISSLNKVGHALHISPTTTIANTATAESKENVFHTYCVSKKIKELVVDELQYVDPVVPQSMYIFKQGYIGGVVNSHQDSTFLYTEPYQTCLGLWLALDPATIDNGCLWVRPKSHINEPVRKQYKRNVYHFGQNAIDTRSNTTATTTTTGSDFASNLDDSSTKEQPKFVMEELYNYHNTVPWDGTIPESSLLLLSTTTSNNTEYDNPQIQGLIDNGFIPIECNVGDLVVFVGELDHLSLPNYSAEPRHTFQLHLVDSKCIVNTTTNNSNSSNNDDNNNSDSNTIIPIEWSKYNWLQYPPDQNFLRLLDYHPNE